MFEIQKKVMKNFTNKLRKFLKIKNIFKNYKKIKKNFGNF